jgi:hypothetical protein
MLADWLILVHIKYDLPVLIRFNDFNSRRHQDTAWLLTTQSADVGCYMMKLFY